MFAYYRNTKDRVDLEKEGDVIDRMDDAKAPIEFDAFLQDLDVEQFNEIARELGYGPDLQVKDDWSVGFYQSTYGGLPCLIFGHTECDFIFLRREDARMLADAHDPGCSDLEWRRRTAHGCAPVLEAPVDPRRGSIEP